MNKDQDIRPASFDDYVGQKPTIDVLRRAVVAARHGDRPCGHVLLAGMAGCIAGDMRVHFNVRGPGGSYVDRKGGSMESLYRRFCREDAREGRYYTVQSMNEDGKIFRHEIDDVIDSGVKRCLRLRTVAGFELVCTPDHPIATEFGFRAAGQLEVGDEILTHQKVRWTKSAGERMQVYRPEELVKHHPHAPTKTVRDKKRGYANVYKRLRRSRAVYEAYLNGLELSAYLARLDAGELDGLVFSDPNDDIHHLDENPTNDVPENLIAIPGAEHDRYHLKERDLSAYVAVDDEIESIEDVGERHVYDIRMKPNGPRNFVCADGFIVHNCGKSSLAMILAAEMGTHLRAAVATAIPHAGELTGLLTSLGRHDVLFLDEIHGLKPAMQELLYTSMEDGYIDLSAGKRMVRLPLQPFTLVGATTRAHLLTGPLRDRFSYTFQLGHYSVPELAEIARKTLARLGVGGAGEGMAVPDAIGRRSRGTPRVANRLARNCRDFMESAGEYALTLEIAEATFDALGLDVLGLDHQDRAYLEILCERLGSPVGVLTIAAQLGLERGVIEGIIEPPLLELGLIARTQKGRVALPAAVKHLHAHAERVRVQQLAEPQPEIS